MYGYRARLDALEGVILALVKGGDVYPEQWNNPSLLVNAVPHAKPKASNDLCERQTRGLAEPWRGIRIALGPALQTVVDVLQLAVYALDVVAKPLQSQIPRLLPPRRVARRILPPERTYAHPNCSASTSLSR